MTAVAENKVDSPVKWERVLLGDISNDISYGYTASSTNEPVGPRMLRITDIQNNEVNWNTVPYCEIEEDQVDKYLLSPNDIVFARTGATVGKSFLIPNNVSNSIYASYLIRVRLSKEINPKYISYFFQSGDYWLQIRKSSAGIGQPNVNGTKLKKLEIPLAPPEQQKRIVAKIEELFSHIDAGIEALKKAKQLLKQYRQSVLKAAVTGELTKEWREANKHKFDTSSDVQGSTSAAVAGSEGAAQLLERILKERRQKWEEQQLELFKAKGKVPKNEKWKGKYKEPLAFSYEGDLPELPESWVWVSPEQIASTDNYALSIGPFGSNLKVSDYREEGVPLVFVRNIRSHYYGDENAKYVSQKKAKDLKAHSIAGGDVLITKMGEPPGDASIYPRTAPDAIITADCIKWRFSMRIKQPELFVHIINSQLVKRQVINRTKGVAQKKISLGTFKSVAFPLPPLDEQAEIIRQIEQKFYASGRLYEELEFQLIKANQNKQSILATAFKGILK